MKNVVIIGVLVLIGLTGGLIFIYSGFYNVAATILHDILKLREEDINQE